MQTIATVSYRVLPPHLTKYTIMTITTASVPEELKTDKSVTPFIIRSIELSQANPIVSYYCKIYVLEHILTNKLHTTSKEIELFTIELLDDTESIKNNTEDEDFHKILNNKQLSLNVALSFTYKLFNSCLETLLNLTSSKQQQSALISKMKATLNFLSLLAVFKSLEDIDWEKISGGKANDWDSFDKLNKEKIKILKYQLSRLLKGEIQVKDELNDEELEKELDKELEEISGEDVEPEHHEQSGIEKETTEEINLPGAPNDMPKFIEEKDEHSPQLPRAPSTLNESNKGEEEDNDNDDSVKLPGVPHFPPDEEDDTVKLPGAPKYLPDDDLSHINKSSTIQVFPPTDGTQKKSDSPIKKPSATKHHPPLTKEGIKQILNRDDTITQVQKHAKFAQSALQFEDFSEAEKQLTQGLELLKILRKQEEEEEGN